MHVQELIHFGYEVLRDLNLSKNIPKLSNFYQMLNKLRNLLAKSTSSSHPTAQPTTRQCQHPYCAPFSYCLKICGEDSLLAGYNSPTSLSTIHEDNFSPLSNPSPTSTIVWDSDFGWGVFCHACDQERCPQCDIEIFESVTGFKDVLTFENRKVRICTPCVHKMCRGWKVKVICKCEACGHLACEKCLAGGNDAGAKCCMGGEGHHEVGETGEDNKGSHPEYGNPAVGDEGISEAQNVQSEALGYGNNPFPTT
jgi:hypothetical protein